MVLWCDIASAVVKTVVNTVRYSDANIQLGPQDCQQRQRIHLRRELQHRLQNLVPLLVFCDRATTNTRNPIPKRNLADHEAHGH